MMQVLTDVGDERFRQDQKWGEQNHPDVSCIWGERDREDWANKANGYKLINDERVAADALGWDTILLEEVYEALAESDPAAQRAELIQVAAVAVAMVECIDRRTPAPTGITDETLW